MLHEYFKNYWDKIHSVRYIFDMWKAKAIKNANKKSELDWPVPQHWNTNSEIHAWEVPYIHSYEGPCGGPPYGVFNTM